MFGEFYEDMTVRLEHLPNGVRFVIGTPTRVHEVYPSNADRVSGKCRISGIRGTFDTLSHAKQYIAELYGLQPVATSVLGWPM